MKWFAEFIVVSPYGEKRIERCGIARVWKRERTVRCIKESYIFTSRAIIVSSLDSFDHPFHSKRDSDRDHYEQRVCEWASKCELVSLPTKARDNRRRSFTKGIISCTPQPIGEGRTVSFDCGEICRICCFYTVGLDASSCFFSLVVLLRWFHAEGVRSAFISASCFAVVTFCFWSNTNYKIDNKFKSNSNCKIEISVFLCVYER